MLLKFEFPKQPTVDISFWTDAYARKLRDGFKDDPFLAYANMSGNRLTVVKGDGSLPGLVKIVNSLKEVNVSPSNDTTDHWFMNVYIDFNKYDYTFKFFFPRISPDMPYELISQSMIDKELDFSCFGNSTISYKALLEDQVFYLSPLRVQDKLDHIKYFAIHDVSSDEAFGWTVKNFIYRIFSKVSRKIISVLVLRGDKTVLIEVFNPNTESTSKYKAGGLPVQTISLKNFLDVKTATALSSKLHTQLMTFRIDPTLPLEKIANNKCLLIGAGTLGCHIARCLVGWGVNTITFLDDGNVSFSNPIRQNLYSIDDIHNCKATSAAKALKNASPAVISRGVRLTVPMPGHNISDTTNNDLSILEKEIQEHDTIFLLTDSRESRWLPTVLATRNKKLLINVALGYDSWLVSRVRPSTSDGCYFCSDIVAPRNSQQDLAMDKRCTVTRSGLSGIASGIAVELFIETLRGKETSQQFRCNSVFSIEPFDCQRNSDCVGCSTSDKTIMDCCSFLLLFILSNSDKLFVCLVRHM